MTKLKRRVSFSLVLLLIAMAVLAGCGSGSGGQQGANQQGSGQQGGTSQSGTGQGQNAGGSATGGQIELRMAWWGSQDRHDRTLKVIELFQEQNPNIKIVPEFSGWDGYWDKLATQAAGKNLPDIIQMDMQYLAEYSARGLLADLNPFVESKVLNLDDVDDIYITGGRVDGKLYALNIGANAQAIAVDPAMFEKAGVAIPEPGYTWDDYVNMARQLKAGLGNDVYVMGLTGAHEFRAYLRGHNLELFNKEGTGLGYDDDKYFIDFYTIWDTLLKEGVLPPPELTANVQGLEDELIVHGKAPNISFHSNQIIALTKAAGRPLQLIIYPSISGGGKSLYLKPGQFLSISSASKHAEAAAKFLDFFTNSIEANDILAAERGVPIAKKVREHLYSKLDDAGKVMFDYMDTLAPHAGDVPLEPPGAGAVFLELEKVFEALSYKQLTPEQAAKEFRARAENILSKNK